MKARLGTIFAQCLTSSVLASAALSLNVGLSSQGALVPNSYVIQLEYRGPSVAFAEHPYRCGTDRASRDILWGRVEGNEAESEADAVVYEGVLERLTEQALCGASVKPAGPRRKPAVVAQPCRAALSGAGDVKARIKIYRRGADRTGAWIVLTPIAGLARVTGNCRSGEMREMQLSYGERTTIEIQTPPDRLMPGRYPAEVVPPSASRWILHVMPASAGPTS